MSELSHTEIIYTEACLADVPQIVNLHFEADLSRFPEEPDAMLPTVAEVREYARTSKFRTRFREKREREITYQPHKAHTVARLGELVVGFSVYDCTAHRLDSLYVSPTSQGSGIGTRLLQGCLRQAGDNPTKLLAVNHTPSVGFYTKHGFTQDDDPVPTQHCPQITPAKRLPLVSMTYIPR